MVLETIILNDKTYLYKNDTALRSYNKVDKDLSVNVKSFNRVYNNVLFCKNYDSNHLVTVFEDMNNLSPNINTLNNFFDKNSNKQPEETSLLIENAVFFTSFTSFHNYVQHVFLDFLKSINFYYDLLKENENHTIIIEFIPHCQLKMFGTHYVDSFNNVSKINVEKIIQFIRDINLNNKIIILSDVVHFQNFESNSIFIKNLNTISFEENDKIVNWIPNLSNFITNKNNEYFGDLMKEIVKKRDEVNDYYKQHNKKFLILEKRTTSTFVSHIRNVSHEDFQLLYTICFDYCNNNNLHLLIWDDELVRKTSPYEQFNICNNAEIIIGFAGSFFMFNYSFEETSIIIFNMFNEFDEKYEVLYHQFYMLNPIMCNKGLKNLYLHFRDVEVPNYSVILNDFLERI
jgi:hypothetical protein